MGHCTFNRVIKHKAKKTINPECTMGISKKKNTNTVAFTTLISISPLCTWARLLKVVGNWSRVKIDTDEQQMQISLSYV